MTVWNILWDIIQWAIAFIVLVLVLTLVAALVIGIWGGVQRWRPRKRTKPYPADLPYPNSHQDDYMAEATVVGRSMYKTTDYVQDKIQLEAFRAGARWGWGFFHRDRS